MICFGFLWSFGEISQKMKSGKNLGIRLLRHDVALRHSVGCPRSSEAEVLKWHLSSTPRSSFDTPRFSYCSHEPFSDFCFRPPCIRSPID